MAQGLSNSFTEKQLALYSEEYYERADLVFRFGALLSLSREGGERLTEATFSLLLENFATVKAGASPVLILMTLAWKAWNNMKSEKFHDWSVPILQSMKGIGVEQRATLYALEIAGLDVQGVCKAFGTDEHSVRKALADSNRFLATNEIRI
jgi:hypothetical protein